MSDFASMASKNTMYNNIKMASEAMIKNGERGIVYNSWDEARRAFPNKEIIKQQIIPNPPRTPPNDPKMIPK